MTSIARRVFFAPQVDRPEDLQDLVARASFYLAHMDLESLTFVAGAAVTGAAVTEATLPYELEVPESFDPCIAERFSRCVDRLEFLSPEDADAMDKALEKADLILLWRLQADCSESWQKRLAQARGKQLFRVDKERLRLEGSFYIEAGFRNEADCRRLNEINHEAFQAMSERLGGRQRAYVFGTGPSADRYSAFDFTDGLSIVCNSIVKDHDLLDHVRPEILCFADPIFHFGCSRYAARFRDEVRRAAERYDFTICIPRKYYSLFVDLLPELQSRTIGIPVGNDRPINLDLHQDFELRNIDNVLTFLLLPIASTLAREIHVIGCDGRPLEDDQYFWNHNPKTQFGDLMDNIRSVHPGFFKLDYNDYYLRHCQNTEKWMLAGEKAGRRYFSMVDSFVPALRRRGPAQAALQQAFRGSEKNTWRVVSINPDLVNSFGHYLHHDLRCRAEIERQEGGFISLANLGVSSRTESESPSDSNPIVPWFDSNSWSISGGGGIADAFARKLEEAITALEKVAQEGQSKETVTVFTMYLADHRHILPVLEAIANQRPTKAVFVLNLFYAHFVVFGEKRHLLQELKTCVIKTRALRRELGVHLCADSSMLCDNLEDLCGEPFRLWPFFSTTEYSDQELAGKDERASPAQQPLVAYYPSNLQAAKGYDLLAEAVEKMSERGIRWVVRELYRPSTPNSMREAADRLRPHAEMVEGILSPDDYRQRMVEADIILVPYRREAFRSRTSGVISDAILLGKPVVTTEGTWCGDQVQRFGNGVTFADGNVEGFIKAVDEVKNNYQRYATRAEEAREPWLQEHSPKAFVNMVREVASDLPGRISKERQASLLGEIGGARRAVRWSLWPTGLRSKLRSVVGRRLRRTVAWGERRIRRLIWRTKRWIGRYPTIDRFLRRYLGRRPRE